MVLVNRHTRTHVDLGSSDKLIPKVSCWQAHSVKVAAKCNRRVHTFDERKFEAKTLKDCRSKAITEKPYADKRNAKKSFHKSKKKKQPKAGVIYFTFASRKRQNQARLSSLLTHTLACFWLLHTHEQSEKKRKTSCLFTHRFSLTLCLNSVSARRLQACWKAT